ncbi:MAG TPA: TIM barrel protein [Rectinemataceae bacterium]|nr:TIM barrel protein [Rectinemataceae bacterium]
MKKHPGEKRNIALSLVDMNDVPEVEEYLARVGDEARFELSYTMSSKFLDELEPLIAGKVLSIHACCPATEFFPNFASADTRVIARSFEDMYATLETALRFGATIVVLHSGYATDCGMPSAYRLRSELLGKEEFRADVRYKDGSICGPDYNRKEPYLRFSARTSENLIVLAEKYAESGVRVAAENLNPRVGYLFHTPDEMVALTRLHPNLGVCLDIGHLYICSFVYGFDYLEGIREIVSTGKVFTCHLHSNSSGPGRFRDDHQSIDRNGFPIGAVLDILAESGANLVLELLEEPLRNDILLRELMAMR